MKISACLITKNEEKNIGRSIQSYQDIVDEIILVDSGSEDETVRVAQSLGARVYHREWNDDFAGAKNAAIDKAAGDWILFLDADEFFEKGHAEIAKKLISFADEQGYDFIMSPRHEMYENDTKVIGMCYVERAFRQNQNIRYRNPIHEYLHNTDGSHRRLCTDDFIIFHTGYDPHLVLDKVERNLKLLLSDRCEENPMRHLYLMEVYARLDRHEDVIREADFLMSMPDFREISRCERKMFRAYIFQIRSMLALEGRYGQSHLERVAAKALRDFGGHPEIRGALSDLYMHFGEVQKAIEHFETALTLSRDWHDFRYDNQFVRDAATRFSRLARLHRANGDLQQEARYLMASLEANKKDESVLFDLLTLTEALSVEEKKGLLGNLYDMNAAMDLKLLSKAACLAGCNDLFMDCLLRWKEIEGFALNDDPGLYCRLLLLQGEYDEMIRMAGEQVGEQLGDGAYGRLYGRILFEAGLAKAYEEGQAFQERLLSWRYGLDGAFLSEVVMELLQAKREDLIRHMFKSPDVRQAAGMNVQERREALGRIFKNYRRDELYEDICVSDHQE